MPQRILVGIMLLTLAGMAHAGLREDFTSPPLAVKSRPLWFWNGPLSRAETEAQIRQSRDRSGYAGFGILPAPGMTPAYTSEAFLDHYGEALDTAAALGLKMCLYDEYWFPSGSANGELARRYPEATARRLDMTSQTVSGPAAVTMAIPPGKLMGIVAMNEATKARRDITAHARGQTLRWAAPAGTWKVMAFICVRDGWDHVDYLNPAAVRRFIELTYQRFYDRFPQHFGTTIDSAFYDEPTFWQVKGGRTWTEDFNRHFAARYGRNPVPDYAALWLDIGPETAAARNALFGLRAELFAASFAGTINAWCREHRISLTGHVDQEEIVNPVGLCGDLMKAFKDQDIPGIDQISAYGRASKVYKVVSSAAYNYDRELVMTECYGAMKKLDRATLYREAMDQYAKGINLMVPHAVWYSTRKVVFPMELSWRDPVWGPLLPAYNEYVGRLNLMLQEGGHVADIAVLYPIATLQAGYHFAGPLQPYEGGVIPPEADYLEVGEALSLQLRHDFTYLHPEVLEQKCTVRGAELTLDNTKHPQRYKVLVMPGSKTIAWSTLEKIKRFYDQGGKVIATTALPERSAEYGKDAQVRQAIQAMFGVDPRLALTRELERSNDAGGKAFFFPQPSAEILRRGLDGALKVYDVTLEEPGVIGGGNLSYIHKRRDGKDIFFFANSSDTPVETWARLRGRHALEAWDPHTGAIRPAECMATDVGGTEVTRVRLRLGPVTSVFLTGK